MKCWSVSVNLKSFPPSCWCYRGFLHLVIFERTPLLLLIIGQTPPIISFSWWHPSVSNSSVYVGYCISSMKFVSMVSLVQTFDPLPGMTLALSWPFRPQKKSWFSAPSSNFYNKKRVMLRVKYSVLRNMWNACIFLMIWYFRLTSSFFFFFFWWEPRHLFFNFEKIIKIKNYSPT